MKSNDSNAVCDDFGSIWNFWGYDSINQIKTKLLDSVASSVRGCQNYDPSLT